MCKASLGLFKTASSPHFQLSTLDLDVTLRRQYSSRYCLIWLQPSPVPPPVQAAKDEYERKGEREMRGRERGKEGRRGREEEKRRNQASSGSSPAYLEQSPNSSLWKVPRPQQAMWQAASWLALVALTCPSGWWPVLTSSLRISWHSE